MGVTPADEIIITDVHASGIADFAVNDNYLPVVAVVKLRDHVHERPTRLGELLHLDASLLHLVVITRKNGDIGDVLMNESHLDALTRLLHKHFLYLLAALVLTEIKIFHVDMVLGIPQVFHQQFKLAVAGRNDFQTIAIRHAGGAVRSKEPCQRPEFLAYLIVLFMSEKETEYTLVGTLAENFNEFLVLVLEIPGLAEIDADHEIQQQADDRKQGDDEKPCYLLGRITVIENDDHYGTDYQQYQKNRKNNPKYCHSQSALETVRNVTNFRKVSNSTTTAGLTKSRREHKSSPKEYRVPEVHLPNGLRSMLPFAENHEEKEPIILEDAPEDNKGTLHLRRNAALGNIMGLSDILI